MAVALVSAILEHLSPFLYEAVGQKVKLVASVEKEILKLQRNFESILALLDDAEEKQFKEKSIKLWLDRLKDLCYDMEDVLDEWNTSRLKMQIDGGTDQSQTGASISQGKVWSLIPWLSSPVKVSNRNDIAEKVKDICERLDEIVKEKDVYHLAARDIDRFAREVESNPSKKRRIESTAFAELSKLHGRDEVKKELVSSLLCGGGSSSSSTSDDVKTISVVGIGGMGKTALAQLIYNDGEVETHFKERIWVCVSEDFDFVGVVKAILRSLNGELAQNLTLQILLQRISKSVEGKKVLLVLDDVWTEEGNDWGSLKKAFVAAATGSRILVTTRKIRVAESMNSFRHFFLEGLNDEVCWKILRQEAFIGRAEEHCKILEDTGRKIAAKCRGLPLAARTLGGMLRFKKTRRDWEDVLNSDIWRMKLLEQEVFTPLLVSYYDLPSPIRRCFSYCSVIPKDDLIFKEELIRNWMAQGYISSIENPEMETTGDEYFECLVARSFFQDFIKDEEGSVLNCKMHDIVVDFARFLMGNEFVFKELHNADDEISQSRPIEEKTRHLSLILDDEKACLPSRILFGGEKLRSIKIYMGYWVDFSQDLSSLCMQQKHLRSLYLQWICYGELPKEVGKLVHLRELNLSRNHKLKKLPEEICDLCNLQSLDLKGCSSPERLPSKMEKLINLRHLDTSYCFSLKSYPKGIGRLTSLRELHGVVVRCDRNDDEEFSLGDLENLCRLRRLSLLRLVGDAIDVGEAERANLRGKKHLAELHVNVPLTMDADDAINVLNPSSSTVVVKLAFEDVNKKYLLFKDMVNKTKQRQREELYI